MFLSLSIFGTINNPLDKYSGLNTANAAGDSGLVSLLNNITSLVITLAGIFAVVNFIAAGFQYLNSQGDPKKIAGAGNKILQTAIGIGIISAAYLIASLLGYILFQDTTALLKPKLFSIF